MVALWNRADHYIFVLWFLPSFFLSFLWLPYGIRQAIIFLSCGFYLLSFFSSPNLSGCRLDVYHTSTHDVALLRISNVFWNVLHATHWKYRTQKIAICAPSHNFVVLYLRNWDTHRQLEKNLLNSNISPTCPYNMVNFDPLRAEICWRVWGTPANFNTFRVLAALLHGTLVVGVSQTLRRWTEGAAYIRQAAITFFPRLISAVGDWMSTILPHMVWP